MNAERSEISAHEARVYLYVKNHAGWVTATDIGKNAECADRTARLHALRLVKLGIFDQAEVFPAHRYRFSEKADKRNNAYMQRLDIAIEVFGLGRPQ